MDRLAACLQEYALPSVDPWMIGAAMAVLVLLLLATTVAWRYVARRADWLQAQYHALDAFLSHRCARPWTFIKSRFYPNELLGLELTLGAGLIILLIAAFAEILEGWVDEETLFQVDQAINCAVQDTLSGPSLDFVVFMTHLADGWWLGVLSLILFAFLLYRGLRWHALALVLAIGAGQALLWGMKAWFSRPRPGQQLLDALGQSFPSGHSFSAAVFYSFCIFLLWVFSRRRPGSARARLCLRVSGTVIGITLILSVALSRLLLSVHWVSDVLGGVVIGLAWLLTSLLLARAWALYRNW